MIFKKMREITKDSRFRFIPEACNTEAKRAANVRNQGLLKKGSAGWIQKLRTSGAMMTQTLG